MKKFKILLLTSIIFLTACQKQPEYMSGGFSVSDFEEIHTGMSYDEVVAILGEPAGTMGCGIVWEVYSLKDGSYVKMLFTGYNQILTKMVIE